ncbi:MAG: lipopolysaccharide kinase InaA family protein [Thermoplasmatota archaeon]
MGEKNKIDMDDDDILWTEIEKKIDESQFESPLFSVEKDQDHKHFSSVIKEIKDGKDNSHLVKIRPPLFLLSGLLSNISRKLSGMDNLKILDNRRWRSRELEHLKELHPHLFTAETEYDNAFLMEKIEGDVAFQLLRSSEISEQGKKRIIVEITEALKNLHERELYHGEPTTQNCILGDDGEVYWIDFEIEYNQDISDLEKKARDLEQLTLSIIGAFEEEGEIGLDDKELVKLIFHSYDSEEVVALFCQNPHLPLLGPHRVYQFSFVSLYRFYQVQLNIMEYLREHTYR